MADWISERANFFRQKLLDTFGDLNEFIADNNILKPISLETFLDDRDALCQNYPLSPVFWSCKSSAVGGVSEHDDRSTLDTTITGDDEDDLRLNDVRVTSPTWVTNSKTRLNSTMHSLKYRIALRILIFVDLIVAGALTDLRGANVTLSVVTGVIALLYAIDDTLLFISADAAVSVWFKADVTITILRVLVELEDAIVTKRLRIDVHLASFRVLACLKLVPRSSSCQIVLVAVVKGYGNLLYIGISYVFLIAIALALSALTLAATPSFGSYASAVSSVVHVLTEGKWEVVYKHVTSNVSVTCVVLLLFLLTLTGVTFRCLCTANIANMLISCRNKLLASDKRKREIEQCSVSLNSRRLQLRHYHTDKSFIAEDEYQEQGADAEQLTTDVLAWLQEMSTERRHTTWPAALLFDYLNLLSILQDNLLQRQLLLSVLDYCAEMPLPTQDRRSSATKLLQDFVKSNSNSVSQTQASRYIAENIYRQLNIHNQLFNQRI